MLVCCGMAVKRMGMSGGRECEEGEGTECEDGDNDTDW